MNKIVRILVIAAVLIAIFIIVSISARDKSVKRETPPLTADTTGLNKEVPVVGIKLEPTEFYELISVTGLLEAWNRTMISSETGGRVIKWNSELGERLKAGQVVVSFDDEVAELQWHQAEAGLESARIAASKAKRDYERQKSLFEKGDLSENIIESVELSMKNAQTGLKAAEAAAGLAKRAFSETKVKMPFNGRLSAKLVVIGQSVPPGTPVAEVVQTDPIKLTIGLSERDIIKVHPGQEVFIHTIGWGDDKEFTGRVYAVGVAADAMTRQFPVEISVLNKHLEIKPGMAATAQILVKVYKEALVVPQDAVTDYGDITRCFLAEGERAVERDVKVSQPQSGNVMFLSGVSPGDTIITVGKASLKDGQKLGLTVE
ncbi:MAG: efflux RND transporter periplasmic adaptor subunit [Candidatus Hatepunaea meridiana]|nr:efflux RND transporter periplasmic adaptor subunit [Candidatus Hatepunaea meridiana]